MVTATPPATRSDGSFLRPPRLVTSIPSVPGLPVIGNLLQFRADRLALHEEAARIGPIVRFSLAHIPVYVVTDADVAHQILADEADAFKKATGLQFLRPMLGDGLLTSEGPTHRRHRKLLAPAFAPKRLAAYGEVMVAETRAQLATWRGGKQVDLARELMELTLAIAGRTMFGADVRGDARTVAEGLELAMRALVDNLTSVVQLGYAWPLPRHRQMRRAVAMLDDVVYRLIAEARAAGVDRGDVLSMLLLARDDDGGPGLTDREIRDEVMTLLLAGHETTANALTWTWYELGRHPAALATLRQELATVVGARAVTVADLPALPFTAAVIDEAMRLHPPAYVTGREAIRDVTIGGHHFPARAILMINIRGIHRRADYFPAPTAFQPARMLPDAKKARPRHHFLPFGAGPRVCIGSHFALMEAQLVLATMIQHASIRTLATHVVPEPLITLRPRGGLPARVAAD
ncbi:MAG: cytochrome P450 [Proteobacteria bacterium]|nr:cytochrome P450 [Pseudomonadota bacterium]